MVVPVGTPCVRGLKKSLLVSLKVSLKERWRLKVAQEILESIHGVIEDGGFFTYMTIFEGSIGDQLF